MRKGIKFNSGYTIIETMIAISLFIVIVVAGLGALLNANLIHNKSQNMRSIMDNLSFIMEDMSRNLRTGYNYHCLAGSGGEIEDIGVPLSCDLGWGIAFESAYEGDPEVDGDQWIYSISYDEATGSGKIFKSSAGGDPASFFQLTPDEVLIDQASSFSVLGAEPVSANPTDKQQPLVGIRLVGRVKYKDVETPFSLQTSVSQRLIDI